MVLFIGMITKTRYSRYCYHTPNLLNLHLFYLENCHDKNPKHCRFYP
ncbi:hypothetical protein [Moraxella lacunata]